MTNGSVSIGEISQEHSSEDLTDVPVAIVDDAYDATSLEGIPTEDKDSLWEALEDDEHVRDEFELLGLTLESRYDLTKEVLDGLLDDTDQCPSFAQVWRDSDVGRRIEQVQHQVNRVKHNLRNISRMEVHTYGTDTDFQQLVARRPRFIFIDWYLENEQTLSAEELRANREIPSPVQAAVDQVKAIQNEWPDEVETPLFVLMSSRPGVSEYATEFCRLSGLLRGMFHAVPKRVLTDPFSFRMHMHLFAESLQPGRQLQEFYGALKEQIRKKGEMFLRRVSDLTLSDYAYIHSLSLKNDGQPLGEYIFWLYNTYLGHLIFAEELREVRDDLDRMTFSETLSSPELPSQRLSEVYFTAQFDESVGPVTSSDSSDLDARTDADGVAPSLSLGDVLKRQILRGDDEEACDGEAPMEPSGGSKPDLYVLITPQCDLAFTLNGGSRPPDDANSILLLPGCLKPLDGQWSGRPRFETDFYIHEEENFRIEWDRKKVVSVSFGDFNSWMEREGYERDSRLRLPFALDLQRAFSDGLSRVGTPVMPPIYQPMSQKLLRPKDGCRKFEVLGDLEDGEAVFSILNRKGFQYVLTFPLVLRLKMALDARLASMREEAEEGGENAQHLPNQIRSLERAIGDDRQWAELLRPFEPPTESKSKKFLGDRIQVLLNIQDGEPCDSKVIIAVSVSPSETSTQ